MRPRPRERQRDGVREEGEMSERGGRPRERQRNGVREEGENGVRHFR